MSCHVERLSLTSVRTSSWKHRSEIRSLAAGGLVFSPGTAHSLLDFSQICGLTVACSRYRYLLRASIWLSSAADRPAIGLATAACRAFRSFAHVVPPGGLKCETQILLQAPVYKMLRAATRRLALQWLDYAEWRCLSRRSRTRSSAQLEPCSGYSCALQRLILRVELERIMALRRAVRQRAPYVGAQHLEMHDEHP